jgi:hypothetical protein
VVLAGQAPPRVVVVGLLALVLLLQQVFFKRVVIKVHKAAEPQEVLVLRRRLL